MSFLNKVIALSVGQSATVDQITEAEQVARDNLLSLWKDMTAELKQLDGVALLQKDRRFSVVEAVDLESGALKLRFDIWRSYLSDPLREGELVVKIRGHLNHVPGSTEFTPCIYIASGLSIFEACIPPIGSKDKLDGFLAALACWLVKKDPVAPIE